MSDGRVHIESDRTRVTTWTIEPGGAIPEHLHEYDYVVVPLVDGAMTVVQSDGTVLETALRVGVPYDRPAGARHRVENRTTETVAFTEVELLP
ncbi:quercetin dioxygenase-like cupin family protein [Pseudoclavibacter chungangensis]|nr:cupin domain-containing protein [Pseudoclavibacter chungangensis]NYJ66649.1 quercetin dioxygenase-like cupin family protein [Pseudoclavibacter chungangensis]